MEPSVSLFLASIVFGFGFAIGQAVFTAIMSAVKR